VFISADLNSKAASSVSRSLAGGRDMHGALRIARCRNFNIPQAMMSSSFNFGCLNVVLAVQRVHSLGTVNCVTIVIPLVTQFLKEVICESCR
jgi:hypothetical protein